MRCTRCNYVLWNLKARKCPECGSTFLPSGYSYPPGAVRFCCPHCDQDYYGTGPNGHLVPAEFTCVRCNAALHMDQMVLAPAKGGAEAQVGVDPMPWLDRSKRGGMRGGMRAWFSTIGMAMVKPARLMRSLPVGAPVGQAWWFALLTSFVVILLSALPILAIVLIIGMAAGSSGASTSEAIGIVAAILGIMLAVGVLMVLVTIAFWGLVTHGVLRMTGETAGGLGRSYQAVCYSSGANIASAVPCIGGYVGWIWWLISAVLMVKEGQRVSGGRASLAVLAMPAAMMGLYVIYVGSMVAIATATPAPAPPAPGPPLAQTQMIARGIAAYAENHRGHGPPHAVHLIGDEGLRTAYFVVWNHTTTTDELVPVASTTLDRIEFLPSEERASVNEAAVAALPLNAVAHRLGDFVFTYHGVDMRSADPDFWTVIYWPDPFCNGFIEPETVVVGLPGGGSRPILGAFAAELAAQNQLRGLAGLPPLPNPATVSHGRPAKAGPLSEPTKQWSGAA